MLVTTELQRSTPSSPGFPCPCLSHSILSPCLKLHHPMRVISISTPIVTNTGPQTSSSSPCKALYVHILCTVSDHPSSAAPSNCSRRTDIALWVQLCRLSRRGRTNRWYRTAESSAGHTVRETWWNTCGERLRVIEKVWGERVSDGGRDQIRSLYSRRQVRLGGMKMWMLVLETAIWFGKFATIFNLSLMGSFQP